MPLNMGLAEERRPNRQRSSTASLSDDNSAVSAARAAHTLTGGMTSEGFIDVGAESGYDQILRSRLRSERVYTGEKAMD